MEATKEKHATRTPGPWSLSLNIHEEDHGDQEYYHIIAKKRMSDIGMIRVAKHKPIRTTDEANARLIAAAPEMYEMLRDLSKVIENLEPHLYNLSVRIYKDKLREVLAKVERGEG